MYTIIGSSNTSRAVEQGVHYYKIKQHRWITTKIELSQALHSSKVQFQEIKQSVEGERITEIDIRMHAYSIKSCYLYKMLELHERLKGKPKWTEKAAR